MKKTTSVKKSGKMKIRKLDFSTPLEDDPTGTEAPEGDPEGTLEEAVDKDPEEEAEVVLEDQDREDSNLEVAVEESSPEKSLKATETLKEATGLTQTIRDLMDRDPASGQDLEAKEEDSEEEETTETSSTDPIKIVL